MTWRKLLVLLNHLPPESALNTAVRNNTPESELARSSALADPKKGSWSTIETFLALLIDELRINTWAYIQVHTEGKVAKPTPISRPGVGARTGKLMTLEQAQKIDPRLRGMDEAEAQAMLDELVNRGR